ncbi:hypothetical protein QJS04_geneDACA013572 [Acorus gramineus]|uniref:Uncharacterized protein n=1 Tax=Acorus gramineus TaxID=55184 RepID=A0AAV9AH95_ACOGR|nr:hypothetical protein QJS04_geneDACA013572 [Acorus gramineus]
MMCIVLGVDYQMKINLCKQKIDDAKGKSIADTELKHLQNELEEEFQTEKLLRQELR